MSAGGCLFQKSCDDLFSGSLYRTDQQAILAHVEHVQRAAVFQSFPAAPPQRENRLAFRGQGHRHGHYLHCNDLLPENAICQGFRPDFAGAILRVVLRKRLRRNQLAAFFANLPPCVVGLEACCGAHYWFRVLSRLGHTVRLIAPQFVKPYVKSQKNDANDAEAICEAVSRPSMRFVPAKRVEQQDLQCLHRVRCPADRLPDTVGQPDSRSAGGVRDCYSAACGPVAPTSPRVLEDDSNELTILRDTYFTPSMKSWSELEQNHSPGRTGSSGPSENAECRRIAAVEGIGPVTATAIVARHQRWPRFSEREAVRRMAGSGAATTLQRRQNKTAGYQQTRRSLSAHTAGAWSQVGGLSGQGKTTVAVAGSTTNNRDWERESLRCARQQECAHSMVPDREAASIGPLCNVFYSFCADREGSSRDA